MRRIAAVSLVLAGLLSGCAGPGRIDTETAPSADFSQRRTLGAAASQSGGR